MHRIHTHTLSPSLPLPPSLPPSVPPSLPPSLPSPPCRRGGDVPPGGRAPVAGTPTQSLGMDTPMFWGENDATLRAVTRLLGVDPERRKAVFGLVQNMGGTLVGPLPTLYARVEVPGEMLAGRFVPEMELRFVRVVPYVEGGPVPVRWEGEAQP